jgi:hypothetical protein
MRQSMPNTTTATQAPTTIAPRGFSKKNDNQVLRAAVRAALVAAHHLSIRVLWTNRVPVAAANSIGGPALAGMKASARDRQNKGVRVRMVHDEYRIYSIVLGAQLLTASAVAESVQTVLPSYLNGRPRGRSVRLDERARIVLRRRGSSNAFVIWSIALLK